MSPTDRRLLAALAIVATVALAGGLGRTDLWPPDEPRVAEISREMSANGSWVIPTLNGDPFLEEPPLFYWLQAGVYRIAGGASTAAARVPAAAGAILGVVVTAGVALRLGASPLVAALVLATAPEYWWMARSATPDTAAAAAATLALAGFFAAWQTGRPSHLVMAAVALSAALWCKSLLPVGLAVVTMALFVVGAGRSRLRLRHVALAAVAVTALGAGWVLLLAGKLGGRAAMFFLVTNHLGRLVGLPVNGHVRSALYYARNLALDLFPWSLVLPAAAVAAWRARAVPERCLPLCWTGGMLIVLTLSASKRAHYLLAAYPGFALLVAQWWPEAWRGRLDHAARRLMIAALVIAGPVLGLVLVSVRADDVVAVASARESPAAWIAMFRNVPATGTAWLLAALLALVGLALLRADHRRSVAQSTAAVAVYVMCIELLLMLVVLPRLNPLCSSRPGAERLGRVADRGVRVVAYGETDEALSPVLFYAQRQLPKVTDIESLLTELHRGPACAVMRAADYTPLTSVLPASPVRDGTLLGFRLVIVETTPGLCSTEPEPDLIAARPAGGRDAQRAQRKPMARPEVAGLPRALTAKTPAPLPVLQAPPRTNAPGRL